ncbi:spherulation-specific family 4 protein [Kineosporia succinea]|uniref:Spherulation-specific family 4 protein n=1 Tax=Kineosporia succinea TaxID=84632 RepID=A0ABT9PCU4_9ACTN|nr:spherulation-specific family 4 protein [Kineosporia succinea]MDP9830528.1 hypothetical protein [Kineosporia succinea]
MIGPFRRRPRPLGLAVPLYVHPVLAPEAWRALGGADLGRGFAVANVASGPGSAPDPVYQDALGALTAAGTPLAGYVDSSYGQRAPELLVAELRLWRELYGITGVFVDQITSHPRDEREARTLIGRLRDAGASRVVVNAGVPAAAVWCETADVVVTFEGPWDRYRGHHESGGSPGRRCHLVHSIPADVPTTEVAARIAAAGAGIAGVSHGLMPNPWTIEGGTSWPR